MISLTLLAGGLNLYVVIIKPGGQYWNGSAFEAYNGTHWGTYALTLVESPAKTYSVAFPAGIVTAALYSILAWKRVGGSPATTDPESGYGDLQWSGTAEILPSGTGGGLVGTLSIGI